jgi:hypothetical protein
MNLDRCLGGGEQMRFETWQRIDEKWDIGVICVVQRWRRGSGVTAVVEDGIAAPA